MQKTVWAVKRIRYGEYALEGLLYDEWEPFAITVEGANDICIVWLRKIVKVEATNNRAK